MKKVFKISKFRRYMVPCVVMAFFVIAGISLLVASRAATPYIAKEPENGTLTEPAEIVTDPQASAGGALKFSAPPIAEGLEDLPTCDTGTNVTFQINTYISQQPNGSTITFPAGRCYISDSVLHVDGRKNLVIDGNGSTVKRITLTPEGIGYPQLTISKSDTIVIKNLTIQGVNTKAAFNANHEHDANVAIRGAMNVTLDNIKGVYAGGDFVTISPNTDVPMGPGDGEGAIIPKNIKVINSSSQIAGRNGISCTGCEDVLVENVTFGGVGYIGFDLELEADFWYGRNITLRNTTWGYYSLKWFSMTGQAVDVRNLTIENNTMTQRTTCQPSIDITSSTPSFDTIIRNNTLLGYNLGISVKRTQGLSITDNKVKVENGGCGSTQRTGVALTGVDSAVINNNDFAGSHTPFGLLLINNNVTNYSACGNRTPGSALFDKPTVCGQ